MARRRRAPTTQLARAGERTKILISDSPLPEVRFRANCLTDTPAGTVHVETLDGTRIAPLGPDNTIDTTGLISMSVVPKADTTITFVPTDRPSNPLFVAIGAMMLVGALAWTFLNMVGL